MAEQDRITATEITERWRQAAAETAERGADESVAAQLSQQMKDILAARMLLNAQPVPSDLRFTHPHDDTPSNG